MATVEKSPRPLYKGECSFLPFEREVSSIRGVTLIVNHAQTQCTNYIVSSPDIIPQLSF
jgi:hypothetical protein